MGCLFSGGMLNYILFLVTDDGHVLLGIERWSE